MHQVRTFYNLMIHDFEQNVNTWFKANPNIRVLDFIFRMDRDYYTVIIHYENVE